MRGDPEALRALSPHIRFHQETTRWRTDQQSLVISFLLAISLPIFLIRLQQDVSGPELLNTGNRHYFMVFLSQ